MFGFAVAVRNSVVMLSSKSIDRHAHAPFCFQRACEMLLCNFAEQNDVMISGSDDSSCCQISVHPVTCSSAIACCFAKKRMKQQRRACLLHSTVST